MSEIIDAAMLAASNRSAMWWVITIGLGFAAFTIGPRIGAEIIGCIFDKATGRKRR